jgi:hypothetical protein
MKRAQISTATSLARYNQYFSLLPNKLNKPNLKILSFGCSEGKEVASLRGFFPEAIIHGCDINNNVLNVARASYPGEIFYESSDINVNTYGPYDLIVCCSVLCIHPGISLDGNQIGLEFELWHQIVSSIDSCLNTDGIFLLINSQFPFRFYERYKNFNVVSDPMFNTACFVNMFTPEGIAAAGITTDSYLYNSSSFPFYVGKKYYEKLLPNDFHDICFQKKGCEQIFRFSSNAEIPEDLPLSVFTIQSDFLKSKFGLMFKGHKMTYVDTTMKCYVYNDFIYYNRIVKRIWFDGSVVMESSVSFKLENRLAAFNSLRAITGYFN